MFYDLQKMLLALGLLAALAVAALAATNNFDQARPGELPAGWLAQLAGPGQAKWEVVRDTTAPSQPNALRQSGWTPNPSFPLCVLTATRLQDGFVETAFKPLRGTNDQAAGVVWRYRDRENYYVARANALENNVVLYKVEKGQRKAIDIVGRTGGYGVSASVPKEQWSRLRVDFAGKRFVVRLDGRELFAAEDATFSDAGSVGLWTKADSVTLFDDFSCGEAAKPRD